MSDRSAAAAGSAVAIAPGEGSLAVFLVGLIAFLTVVDLFATQVILPSLANAYQCPSGNKLSL